MRSDMLAFPLIRLCSSALPRGPILLRPGFLPGFRGGLCRKTCGWGTGAKPEPEAKPQQGRSRRPRSGPRDRSRLNVVTQALRASMTYSAALLSLRSRSWPSTSNQNLASRTRQEAGSKEKWDPLWSAEERSDLQGKATARLRRMRRADANARRLCRRAGPASCAAACKARAPQGTPGAGCTRGAEVGCLLSSFWASRKK
jgi:hypothetical protein